jgi:prepilin-type N-terminal cleavage/methylation domain-containing protein
MENGKKSTCGFSLVELVIVIAILSIVVAGVSQLLTVGFNSYFMGKNIISADWQGRVAIEKMTRDLHLVRSRNDIVMASSNSFSFISIDGSPISYSQVGSQLIRNTSVLAGGVQSLSFQYFDSTGSYLGASPVVTNIRYIVISLNVTSNNASYVTNTAVYPWNLR